MLPGIRVVRASRCATRFLAGALALIAADALAAPREPQPKAGRSAAPPALSTESLPILLQRGAQAFAAGNFAGAAQVFTQVESEYGRESEWTAGTLPRRLLPLRGYARLRAGQAGEAAGDLASFLERYSDETAQRGFARYALALALQQAGRPEDAIAQFATYAAEHAGTPQAALAALQQAEILFDVGRADDAFALLAQLAADTTVAGSLQDQARLRALENAVALKRDALAVDLLLGHPWSVTTMPEIAVLAFAAMETGDRLLAAGRHDDAVRAYRHVLPKDQLIAAQRTRLEELQRLYDERAPTVTPGAAQFWVDFYRARIERLAGQLAALEAADDYSWPLRLRLGQALLLAHRGREAWLCFESVATAQEVSDELRRDAHYRWILAAAELGRWDDAVAIARGFVERFPASELAPEAFFLISRAHLERQDFAAAEPVLTDIITQFPGHPAALRSRFTRGWLRTVREDYVAARADFEACVAADPTGPLAVRAGLWRGLTHHFARERDQALVVFDSLIQAHPQHPLIPEILFRRATTLYAMRDLPRAEAAARHVVTTFRMHERHGEALVLLGDILMATGDLDEAQRCFADVPPEVVDSYVYAAFQVGKILRARGEHAAMVGHFAAYVREAGTRKLPRVSEAMHLIGWAEEQRGHPEAALPLYAEALARFGDDTSAGEVGTMIAALQRLSRRIGRTGTSSPTRANDATDRLGSGDYEGWLRAERTQALARHQETWHARLTLALADWHISRKEPAQAEILLLELAGSTPLTALDASALARVGAALQSIGSEDGAAYFQRLLAHYPRSPERAAAFLGLARESARQRRFAEALAWTARFEEETPADPLGPKVALLAGDILEQTGRLAEASRRYEDLLRLKSARGRPHAEALAGLARCARAEGDAPRAIACFQRVYTLHRAQSDLAAHAYLESAPLFEQLGDLAAAAATYREMLALTDVGDAAQREQARRALESLEQRLPPVTPSA